MMKEGQLPLCCFGQGAAVCSSHRELQLTHSKPHSHNQATRTAGKGGRAASDVFFSLLSILSTVGDVNKGAEVDSSLATN